MNELQRNELQQIYKEIGTHMRDLAPPEAATMLFIGMVYATHEQGGIRWLDDSGKEHIFSLEQIKANPAFRTKEDRVRDLMRKLRRMEPFASQGEPFTHYRITLTHQMKFAIDFAYIPEEQSWARVYMKPVGALTAEEAKALYVPEEHWLVRKRLHEGEITKAEFDAEIARLDAEFEVRKAARGGALR